MSRPVSPFLLLFAAVLGVSFTGCVGTIYDRMYSPEKSYFKAPPAKKTISAEQLLGPTDALGTPPSGEIPASVPSTAPTLAPAGAGAPEVPGVPAN